MPHLGGEVKSITVKTGSTSTTAVTVATPASGKRIRVISVNCSTANTYLTEFEVYFGAGANIDTTTNNAIFAATLIANAADNKSTFGAASISFPDLAGPIGEIDEVVALRTSENIVTSGRVILVYREE